MADDFEILLWVEGADRLVLLEKQRETETARDFSYPAFLHLREQSAGVFDTIAAFSSSQALARTSTGISEWITGEIVSGNLFADFGVTMTAGRPLTPDDDRDGAQPAIVVSHRYWQSHFAGQTLNGQTLTLNDQTFTIAGVAAPSFLGCRAHPRHSCHRRRVAPRSPRHQGGSGNGAKRLRRGSQRPAITCAGHADSQLALPWAESKRPSGD